MADRPSGSGTRVITLLGLFLLAAVAVITWLALRADPAPPRPPKPPVKAHVAEPPTPPRPPRPKALQPVTLMPESSLHGPKDGQATKGADERGLVKLTVLVLGSNGLPAPGAAVLLLDPFAQHVQSARPTELARTKADDSGHAKFDVAPRNVRLYAWLGSEAGASDKFTVTEAAADIAVQLSPAIGAHGRVVETGGAPVGDAAVRFVAAPWLGDPFGVVLETKSAADGTFELPAIPAQAFDPEGEAFAIEARAKGWPMTRVAVTADTLRAGEVVVTLERGAFLRGRCVGPTGAAVAQLGVRLTSGASSVPTDKDGKFELPLPRAGGVAITAPKQSMDAINWSRRTDGGAAKLLGRFRGDGGDIDLGDVTLSAGQPVKGQVVDLNEQPVKAGDVVLYLAGVQVDAAQTDDAGKFEFDAVGDDPHVLVATEAPGENAWTGRRHTSVDGVRGGAADLHVVMSGALTVLVKFQAEADNSPVVVPEVTLRATAAGSTPKGYGWTWAGSRIDSVRFEVEHAGTYNVTVELPGYEPATATGVEVSADREFTLSVLFRKKP